VQFAKESIHDERPLKETFQNSSFLREFREIAAGSSRGCIVLERPDLLKSLVEKHGARDTTARHAAMAELDAMQHRSSQWAPGEEVPEKSLVYRLVKKYWFNDFGAYKKLNPAAYPLPATAPSARPKNGTVESPVQIQLN
jgi:hypothetical protein